MKKVTNEIIKNEVLKNIMIENLNLPNPIIVECRRIGLKSKGVPHECHTNVAKMVSAYGGHQLIGYGIGEDRSLLNFCSHSVWLNPEGRAVCLTLGDDQCRKLVFIPMFVMNQSEIIEFFSSDTQRIKTLTSFIANTRGNWMCHNDKQSNYDACVEVLSAPRQQQNTKFSKLLKWASKNNRHHILGNPKKRDINISIQSHLLTGGISSQYLIENHGHKTFMWKVA